MTLAEAILLIPPGSHLTCGQERNSDDDTVFASAVLFAEPPEEGWPDPVRHPADKFRDRVISSISADVGDSAAFTLLVVHLIVSRFGTPQQLVEARRDLETRP